MTKSHDLKFRLKANKDIAISFFERFDKNESEWKIWCEENYLLVAHSLQIYTSVHEDIDGDLDISMDDLAYHLPIGSSTATVIHATPKLCEKLRSII